MVPVSTGHADPDKYRSLEALVLPLPAKITIASVFPAEKFRVKPKYLKIWKVMEAIAAVRVTTSEEGAEQGMTKSS